MSAKRSGTIRVMAVSDRPGFSIVELLVVISIITVLLALSLPTMGRARLSSRHVRWMAYAKNLSIDPDLVLYYPLFEAEGSATVNQALNPQGYRSYNPEDYNGALIGDASWEEGRWPMRKGVQFTGSSSLDQVAIGTPDVQGHETSFNQLTILAWFKVNEWDRDDARIVSKATGTGNSDHFWMLSTKRSSSKYRLRFRLQAGGSVKRLTASGGEILLGQWVHAAAVYDGSKMYLFQDGELVGSRSHSGPLDADETITAAIGNQPVGGGTKALDGVIDEVAIFNRAWSQSDIKKHMEIGHP